jgi:hypothetical protein
MAAASSQIEGYTMLKTVSDPPHNPHSLEGGILQTMEYA